MKTKVVPLILFLLGISALLSNVQPIRAEYTSNLNSPPPPPPPSDPAPISTIVNIHPSTLNLNNKGRWITVCIELGQAYGIDEIDVSTIRLNHEVKAECVRVHYDVDGINDLMLKFDRAQTVSLLGVGEATLTITGKVNEASFEGTNTIRVING